MAHAYAKEKQFWLFQFQRRENISYIKNNRIIRNNAVAARYRSTYGLQARLWKLALQDAAETMDKYWQSLFDRVKKDIYQSSLSDAKKHYAYWLLKDYGRLADILIFKTPSFKELPLKERKHMVSFLNRKLRTHKKKLPQVKKTKSFLLDANCYNRYQHGGRQYIHIMTLTPRKRLAIPLLGFTPIKGNVRIVLKGAIIEIHYTSELKTKNDAKNDTVIAVDFGYSEVMTDSEGKQYGTQLGNILTIGSDHLNQKMQHRNKLHALQKKYRGSLKLSHQTKAKNILHFNLGHIKLEEHRQKLKAKLSCEINTAFNQLIKKKQTTVVSESLSHSFDFKSGRKWNRRLSAWVKGELKERLAFKALAEGFSHYQVNPAYTSQTCPLCDYVDAKNRKSDRFQCLHCRYVNHADWVAAMNLKSRYNDPEITRYTPYRDVKKILLARFHRRLEMGLPRTVNGRIPDTAIA